MTVTTGPALMLAGSFSQLTSTGAAYRLTGCILIRTGPATVIPRATQPAHDTATHMTKQTSTWLQITANSYEIIHTYKLAVIKHSLKYMLLTSQHSRTSSSVHGIAHKMLHYTRNFTINRTILFHHMLLMY